MACALEEAENFLWRYPQAVTDIDDPIEILRDLVKDAVGCEGDVEQLGQVNEQWKTRAKKAEQENVRLRVIIKGLQKQVKPAKL